MDFTDAVKGEIDRAYAAFHELPKKDAKLRLRAVAHPVKLQKFAAGRADASKKTHSLDKGGMLHGITEIKNEGKLRVVLTDILVKSAGIALTALVIDARKLAAPGKQTIAAVIFAGNAMIYDVDGNGLHGSHLTKYLITIIAQNEVFFKSHEKRGIIMCGIMGYAGDRTAAGILLSGLSRLEYRGYDSAGIATVEDGRITVVKAKGRLTALQALLKKKPPVGKIGIGHTRWATHGEPTERNAHPHSSVDGAVVGVHNGIIENFSALKEQLSALGYAFSTETDTEVAVCVVHEQFIRLGDPIRAMAEAQKMFCGSYAMAFLFQGYPNEIFVMRKDSPLVVGVGDGETFLASDIPAVLPYTRQIISMENGEMARLSRDGVMVYSASGLPVEKSTSEILWSAESAEKGGFAHFMMKEIHEQPRAVRDTLCTLAPSADILNVGLTSAELRAVDAVHIVACGSAYHAGLVSATVIERLAHVPVRVELASEFRYREPILGERDLVLLISQSGETADTLGALREAKRQGVCTLAVVNVRGSSIASEADRVIYTAAGPEIAVATTKAYSAQLAALDVFAIAMGLAKGMLSREKAAAYLASLAELPEKIEEILCDTTAVETLAGRLSEKNDVFFIGRGQSYAACLEGSLKLKEISYIHSEAYAAGELKHGTLSLIDKGTPVIGVAVDDALYPKTAANLMEAGSRGAFLIVISSKPLSDADVFLQIPQTDPLFMPSLLAIPLQLLAYHVSVARGHDVDKPRNLAKSVTVE